MIYRVGNHNPALVYGELEDAEHYTPRPAPELVAVFVRQGGEHELDALHYVRAMNATMPTCTCRVICCCGALVGSTSGCESCMEHNGECVGADLGELLGELVRTVENHGHRDHAEGICVEILQRFGWLGRYAQRVIVRHVDVSQENGS